MGQTGNHQFARPVSCSTAGVATMRTSVASSSTATAMPNPMTRSTRRSPRTKAAKTQIMMAAAELLIRPVLARPLATAQPERDREVQHRAVSAFLAAARHGDFEALLRVLAPGVVLRFDLGPGRELLPTLAGARAVAGHVLQTAPRFVASAGPPPRFICQAFRLTSQSCLV